MLAKPDPKSLTIPAETQLHKAGRAANKAAGRAVFSDYQSRKAANTLRRQVADLNLFAQFLAEVGAPCGDLVNDPAAWRGITWGPVAAWQKWQLVRGYSVSSVNVRLSTVKTYARLALKAGSLKAQDYAMIRAVEGYQHKEAPRIDEGRKEAGQDTRKGFKKAQAVSITPATAKVLRTQPDTPQGRRDGFMLALLLDHGLRVGEVAMLTVDSFDLTSGEFTFFRPKVDKLQTHRLTPAALKAARAYLETDAPASGCIWRSSGKGGKLGAQGLTTRAITQRVHDLGAAVGLAGLSAHDCRHFWATQAARNGTQIDRLQDAGGWSSPAMPLRYVESAAIANEGVRLGEASPA